MDFGFKRIGLAIAEAEFGIVTPRPSILASGTLKRDADALAQFARKEAVDQIVLGLPVEEDGNQGKMARVCETVAGHLRELGFSVDLIDERYSSIEAENVLRQEDLKASQRRKLRDGEAAGILVERFLEAREKG